MFEELLVKELGFLRFEVLRCQASCYALEREVQELREFKAFVDGNEELSELVKELRDGNSD